MQDFDSTVAEITVSQRSRLARTAKHGFVVLLLVICIAGVLGGLGGRTATANAAADDYRLTLQYPLTARPGLDTLWELRTSHAGGFRGPITIRVTADYFQLFETQGFYPTPSVVETFSKALVGFKTGKSSIQFPLDKPLPLALIRKLAAFRVREVNEKDAKWM